MALFWEKFNFDEYIPMVPTSAITGDGMGDLMAMMVLMCQKFLLNKLMWSQEVEATVLEVCCCCCCLHDLLVYYLCTCLFICCLLL